MYGGALHRGNVRAPHTAAPGSNLNAHDGFLSVALWGLLKTADGTLSRHPPTKILTDISKKILETVSESLTESWNARFDLTILGPLSPAVVL